MTGIFVLLQDLRALLRMRDIDHWATGRTLYAVCRNAARQIRDDRTIDLAVWKSQRLSILNAAEYLPHDSQIRIKQIGGGFRVYPRNSEWHERPYINLFEYVITDCGRYAVIDNENVRRRRFDTVFSMSLLQPLQPFPIGKRGHWVYGPAHGQRAIKN